MDLWPHVVAAVHKAGQHKRIADGVTVLRVVGGANNALYRVEVDGQAYACKLCVNDERRRAEREFQALRLLRDAGLDIAPRPLWLDDSCAVLPYPAVAYEWLRGAPLSLPLDGTCTCAGAPVLAAKRRGQRKCRCRRLAALLDSIQQAHALRRDDFPDSEAPDAFFHWFAFEPYLAEMGGLLAEYGRWLATHDPDGPALLDRLTRLLADCADAVARSDAVPDRDRVPLCLCRVDANLANAIWCDDGRLRWVDWEYSGWGDPAFDFADLRWHAALDGLTRAQHAWLRENYRRPADDAGFEARLAVWDRILAARWPLLMLRARWSHHNGPDRVRLTRPVSDEADLRARLIRFIERAESARPA